MTVTLEQRERQKVFNQPAQASVLDREHLEIFARLLRVERLIGEQSVHQHAHRRQRTAQFMRRRCDQVGLEPGQSQVAAQRSGGRDADDGDYGDAGEGDRDVEDAMLPVVRIELRRFDRHERELPSRQPRSGGDRFRIGAHIRRHGEENDAAWRHLMEEVVHHLLEAADAVEGDHSLIGRCQRRDVRHGRLTNHVGHWRGALGSEHLQRQTESRFGRQLNVGRELTEPRHEQEPLGGRHRSRVIVQSRGDGLDERSACIGLRRRNCDELLLEVYPFLAVYRATIGVLDRALRIQEDRAIDTLAGNEPIEALFGRARAGISARGMGMPDRIESRAHQAQLAAIGLEYALMRRRRRARQRVVHEPQHAGRRQNGQEGQQDKQPGAAVEAPVASKSDGHLG